MPSGRRPPPPPPPRDSEPTPPPLPSRNLGNPKLVEQTDDTYEQPACQPNSSMTAKLANLSLPVDNCEFDDFTDSDFDDSPDVVIKGVNNTVRPSVNDAAVTLQSDDTYITPDGGIVPDDDDYNLPNDTQPKTQIALKPRPAVPSLPVSEKPSVTREDKNNNIGIKLLPDNRPKPPPNKPSANAPEKPSVKPKPLKPSDSSLPKLPPRPGERHLKTQDSKSNLVDGKISGSVSSESNSRLQDTKKTAFQAKAEKFENIIGKKVPDEQKAQEAPIYDDGASEILSKFDWFHGELDRDEGAKRVKKLYENGAFLIRASKSDGSNSSHPYTLVVTLDHKVYNLKIRLRHDNRFAIGTYKSDEVSFPTVPELVEHHKENNIKLAEGGTVKLQRTPRK